jgi:hypothetical protein
VHFSFFTFFSVSCHIPGHTVFVSHFPVFHYCRHNPGPPECISHISSFTLFLAVLQVKQCAFLIFHVFQCVSPHSRSYSVCFTFFAFFCFLNTIRVPYSVYFLNFTFFTVSLLILIPTVCVSHFTCFSVF